MFWNIFIGYLVLGGLYHMFNYSAKTAEPGSTEQKISTTAVKVLMWIIIACGCGLILYGIGWIWYWLCGGFLVHAESSFLWKIIDGLLTLIPLGFILGFIAICCGWRPPKM